MPTATGGPRVLVLATYYPSEQRPGYGTYVHDQALAFVRGGAEVRVFRPIPRAPFPLPLLNPLYREAATLGAGDRYEGMEVRHARYWLPPRNWLHERVGDWMTDAIADDVTALHREWPFDLVYTHTTYPCGHAANRIRDERLPGVPVVQMIHRASIIDTPRFNAACAELVRRSLEGADATVFGSREGLAVARELTGGRFRREPECIVNAVDPGRFALGAEDERAVAALRARYPDTRNLLFVGALCERKGTWELLDAFRELVSTRSERLQLWLVGPNLLGRALEGRIRRLGLAGRVTLAGAVAHDDVKRWMGAADLFVLPSHSEGVATVLFEALHAGLPSVFTDAGGTSGVIENGKTALLVPPRSVPELTRALARLLDDPALCERLGRAGRELVLAEHTWDRNAERNLAIFDALLHDAN